MILVILGAGASFDSVSPLSVPDEAYRNQAWRPPLAKDLFAARENFNIILNGVPDCRGFVVSLRDRLATGETTLEGELAKLERLATTDARSASQLMAVRFYIQRVIDSCGKYWSSLAHGATNYHALVDALDRWSRSTGDPVIYVTFNYDTMVEDALTGEMGMRFESMADYTAHDRAKLFKLHGSVDWAHHMTLPAVPTNQTELDWLIKNASDVSIPNDFEIRRDWSSGIRGEIWVPALAVPIQEKDSFECPAEHVALLRDLLPYTTRLLVIGWRGLEASFLEILQDNFAQELESVVVACADADESRRTWLQVHQARRGGLTIRGSSTEPHNLGFSGLVASPEFEGFLG